MKTAKTNKKNAGLSGWRNRQVVALISALVLLGAAVGIATSHDKIVQRVNDMRYGYEARQAFGEELSTLGSTLATFGVKKGAPSKCISESIYQYATPQLQCSVSETPYILIGSSQAKKAHFVQQAGELDSLFKQNGWTEDKNTTPTIRQWFEGITSGKDWYADEGAFKNIGNSHCSIDFFLAFSNPKPPAFTVQTSCTSPILQKYKNQLF